MNNLHQYLKWQEKSHDIQPNTMVKWLDRAHFYPKAFWRKAPRPYIQILFTNSI